MSQTKKKIQQRLRKLKQYKMKEPILDIGDRRKSFTRLLGKARFKSRREKQYHELIQHPNYPLLKRDDKMPEIWPAVERHSSLFGILWRYPLTDSVPEYIFQDQVYNDMPIIGCLCTLNQLFRIHDLKITECTTTRSYVKYYKSDSLLELPDKIKTTTKDFHYKIRNYLCTLMRDTDESEITHLDFISFKILKDIPKKLDSVIVGNSKQEFELVSASYDELLHKYWIICIEKESVATIEHTDKDINRKPYGDIADAYIDIARSQDLILDDIIS